ncbi:hypothetical protein JHK82_038983 [Glycine max]|nr:hypothetical protein JHK82_038983 [Glycine max]KAG5121048.1 hypothetical protein JHK84_039388 [Glycine max]
MSTVVAASRNVEVVFEKLLSKDFENYMQTYSIVLGHDSKKSTINVDVNLFSLGGGMHISHHHACIFYDFAHQTDPSVEQVVVVVVKDVLGDIASLVRNRRVLLYRISLLLFRERLVCTAWVRVADEEECLLFS